ncbi:MAG: thiamine pyrophosphate-dependent enzyme [Pseudomonadota bacterium]
MPVPPVNKTETTSPRAAEGDSGAAGAQQTGSASKASKPSPPIAEPPGKAKLSSNHPEPNGQSMDDALEAYRLMLRIRRFEEKAGQLYGMGDIAGFCHLYIGQEAIAAGLSKVRQPGDRLITAYRNHGHALASGADVTAMMSELCGRASGLSEGKAGSVHLFWPDGGFYGGNGIVGGNVPIGAGLAFADRYNGNTSITWCIIGDAAMAQGQVFEAMQLAASLSLPIVFVIESNNPPLETDPADANHALAERGLAFGLKGVQVDGMDVEAVATAAIAAAESIRAGGQPCVIECKTKQYRGHSMADPGKYQAAAPTSSQHAAQDPISRMSEKLLRNGVLEDVLRNIDRAIRDEINAATAFAKSDGEPSEEQLVSDIRAKGRAGQTAYRRVHGEPSTDTLANAALKRQGASGGRA